MSEVEAANAAALKIQSRYKAYRTRRAIDGMTLSKADWQTVLNQVNILLRSSQFKEAQPKELSVRGKWVRCLGSAGAIGRVSARLPCSASCLHLQRMCRSEVRHIDRHSICTTVCYMRHAYQIQFEALSLTEIL